MHTTDLSLHDEISAPWHVAITCEVDSGSFADHTRVLATNIIVPQSGRYEVRRQVSQSNDKVVRQITLNAKIFDTATLKKDCFTDIEKSAKKVYIKTTIFADDSLSKHVKHLHMQSANEIISR